MIGNCLSLLARLLEFDKQTEKLVEVRLSNFSQFELGAEVVTMVATGGLESTE